jgi:peptide/nickel transport system permease protein
MLGLVLRRVLFAIPTLFGLAVLVFLLGRLLPGDVVTNLVGPDHSVSPERLAELRRLFGLDLPLHVQLGSWLQAALHGDLGTSLRTGRKVAADLALRGPITAELSLLSIAVAVALALPLAIAAAARPGRALDRALSLACAVGLAVPGFWLGLLLVLLFSLWAGALPPAGFVPIGESVGEHVRHLVLPVLTLGLLLAAAVWRMARATLGEVLTQDYIRTARAKGLRERAVLYRHALRNAALPIVTAVGLQLGNLLGGTVLIEQIFGLPGVGRYAVEGINLRDYPVIQGATLWIGAAVIAVNTVVDALYALLDPRLRS